MKQILDSLKKYLDGIGTYTYTDNRIDTTSIYNCNSKIDLPLGTETTFILQNLGLDFKVGTVDYLKNWYLTIKYRKTSISDLAGDILFTNDNHTLTNATPVIFLGTSYPKNLPLTLDDVPVQYYVVSATANTFKVSNTVGGVPITYDPVEDTLITELYVESLGINLSKKIISYINTTGQITLETTFGIPLLSSTVFQVQCLDSLYIDLLMPMSLRGQPKMVKQVYSIDLILQCIKDGDKTRILNYCELIKDLLRIEVPIYDVSITNITNQALVKGNIDLIHRVDNRDTLQDYLINFDIVFYKT